MIKFLSRAGFPTVLHRCRRRHSTGLRVVYEKPARSSRFLVSFIKISHVFSGNELDMNVTIRAVQRLAENEELNINSSDELDSLRYGE